MNRVDPLNSENDPFNQSTQTPSRNVKRTNSNHTSEQGDK